MAIANQQGNLLLTTGNKSELALGYCTLYGDMNGGLSVIGDLYKTTVFALCDWIDSKNSTPYLKELGLPIKNSLIGKKIREKAPSAELRPNQKDSDSLPDYKILDEILKLLIEDKISAQELVDDGKDKAVVMQICRSMKNAEFKRYQAAPIIKISSQAFGEGWRNPIAAYKQF